MLSKKLSSLFAFLSPCNQRARAPHGGWELGTGLRVWSLLLVCVGLWGFLDEVRSHQLRWTMKTYIEGSPACYSRGRNCSCVVVSGFYLHVPAPCICCSHVPVFWAVTWMQKYLTAARNCALLLLPCFLVVPPGSLSSCWTLRGNLEEGGLHLDRAGTWSLTP